MPPGQQRRNQIPDMINITERPAEADDRAVPGHWEGDLILGKNNLSAIGTLVERTTGYTMLVHLPDGYKAEQVRDALTKKIKTIPDILRASLTWDQGIEMRDWKQVSVAADIDIYFCDPHSPWQRATNENTNGLLRQYFPKGTDLSVHSATRPRLGRHRAQRPTAQTLRLREADRRDRTTTVAMTARIRQASPQVQTLRNLTSRTTTQKPSALMQILKNLGLKHNHSGTFTLSANVGQTRCYLLQKLTRSSRCAGEGIARGRLGFRGLAGGWVVTTGQAGAVSARSSARAWRVVGWASLWKVALVPGSRIVLRVRVASSASRLL